MKILFCGTCLPREFESKISMLSVAGNQYQNNLIKTLKNTANEVHILSYISIPLELPIDAINEKCKNEGYIPVFAGNKFSAFLEYRKRLREEIRWAECVITYNSMYPWFGVGAACKKSVLVLADYTPPNEEKSIPRKINSFFMGVDFKRFKKVILLSAGSKKYLSSKQERTVINGCIDFDKYKEMKLPCKGKVINIVYSGVLSKVTGVDLLIEAFRNLKGDNYRLILCGQGKELDEMIDDAMKQDKRIIYKGFLSTEEYLETIEEAHILVNPRNMGYSQNLNNFPSKILEYLAAGRLIVSTRFTGYEDYTDNITFVDSNPRAIMEGIEMQKFMDSENVYRNNREFVQKYGWESMVNYIV